MKFLARNAEVTILVLIIFYVFFTLTVMYENKIVKLKNDLINKNECISEDSLYFQLNGDNQYKIKVTFGKKIAEGYIQVQYNDVTTVLQLNPITVNKIIENARYLLIIENTSNYNVIKSNLQELISVNKLLSIEQEV